MRLNTTRLVIEAMYVSMASIGYVLVRNVAPRFAQPAGKVEGGEYIELALTAIGAAGAIVGAWQAFFRSKTRGPYLIKKREAQSRS